MNRVKDIIGILFAIFLAFRTWELIRQLHGTPPDSFGTNENLVVVLMLSLFVTGFFAFTGFALPTHKLLPKAYYRVRKPVFLRFWYRYLGGSAFRLFLKIFFWGPKNTKKRFFNGRRDDVQRMVRVTKQSEFSHLMAFIVLVFLSIDLLVLGFEPIFWGTTIINVVGNLYPVLLQRLHRVRITEIFNL